MFHFKLELEDGTPADPPTLTAGRTELEGRRHDPARAGYSLRVIAVREGVLVVAAA